MYSCQLLAIVMVGMDGMLEKQITHGQNITRLLSYRGQCRRKKQLDRQPVGLCKDVLEPSSKTT